MLTTNHTCACVFAIDASYTFSHSDKKLLTTIHVPSITFYVGGIPFTLGIVIPVEGGYQIDVNAELHASMFASASGSLKVGFQGQCTSSSPSSCQLQKISEHAYRKAGNIGQLVGGASGVLQVYVTPTVVMSLDHIGEVSAGLRNSVELMASHDETHSKYCTQNFPDSIAQVSANYQFEATIGGKIDLQIGSVSFWMREFKPVGIYNLKKSLGTGCLGHSTSFGLGHSGSGFSISKTSSSAMVVAAPIAGNLSGTSAASASQHTEMLSTGYAPGTTWNGVTSKISNAGKCASFPTYSEVTMQVQSHDHYGVSAVSGGNTADVVTFIGSQNFGNSTSPQPYACIVQVGYQLVITNAGILLQPTPGAGVRRLSEGDLETLLDRVRRRLFGTGSTTLQGPGYALCTNGPPKSPSGWFGSFDRTKGKIVLQDKDGCTNVKLTMTQESKRPLPHTVAVVVVLRRSACSLLGSE